VDEVRVVLVDDQQAFLRALEAVVDETPGFTVVGVAASGESCLAQAAALLPDMVLLDVNLPGIDGVETATRLMTSDMPLVVVLLSTYDEDVGERFVADSGAAAYLTKSAFSSEQLQEIWARCALP